MALLQMERDGVGAGIQPLVGQGLAELDHLLTQRLWDALGAGVGPA
jgi:hypothetical protein